MAKHFLTENLLRLALKNINEEIQVDPVTGEWYDDGKEDNVTPHDDWEDAVYKHEMSKNNVDAEDMDEDYGVQHNGSFIRKEPGWGPTFTMSPQDAKAFKTPEEAQAYIDDNLPDFGASVAHIPGTSLDDEDELYELKKVIKGMIRESINNMGGIQSIMPMQGGDIAEKKYTKKSAHSQFNQHYKTNPKTGRQARQTKRAIVIKWLRDPSVNCAEIMRQLWRPSPEDEDTKRGEFYKKRDGAINKDTGARYSFSEEEINTLYRIKSSTK